MSTTKDWPSSILNRGDQFIAKILVLCSHTVIYLKDLNGSITQQCHLHVLKPKQLEISNFPDEGLWSDQSKWHANYDHWLNGDITAYHTVLTVVVRPSKIARAKYSTKITSKRK